MSTNGSMLSDCTSGGCGAKIGPGELSAILSNIPRSREERLLVGYDSSDDAAVYQINDKQCIISTVDFFSPMVDDPECFGKIAAANALSDVYAMGGTPAFALNLVCFPQKRDKLDLEKILCGGAQKVIEAGAVIAGGHSIYDHEPKYGLAVTGFVDKDMVVKNNTPAIGHSLILTKSLGVGIVMSASRVGLASDSAYNMALESMMRLNKYSAEKMIEYGKYVSACTDVTGFGLLAHLLEMCEDKVSAEINIHSLPVIPDAIEYANEYILTAAGQRNRNHFGSNGIVEDIPFWAQELMFDPQTSGGLLICVDSAYAEELLDKIKDKDPHAMIVGKIIKEQENKVIFK